MFYKICSYFVVRLVKIPWHAYPKHKPPGMAEVPPTYRKKVKYKL